jgi:hypothetical protein
MSTGSMKPSSDEMAKTIQKHHQKVSDAAHAVLSSAGLHGVKVHSIRYSVDSTSMAGSPCTPPCPPGQTCTWVMGPSGGEWECV